MPKNLVIVESPAKAKTIEKFLGKDYKVLSSKGHIRDLKKKNFGVDLKTFQPQYEIPEEKKNTVRELQSEAKKADCIWLASDEDREGEAISWHLAEVLKLDPQTAKRIVFHEITKQAIEHAISHPRHIDLNLVDAQQARRVLDRLVGFKLSPILWKKVKPNLSAGRVQSVAVRIIVEREREIETFKPEASYRVSAIFTTPDGQEVKATYSHSFSTKAEVEDFLENCKNASFAITDIQKKPLKRSPAPPFTTSTLQQEAARKLGFSVSLTMRVAQSLYEAGHITYMRTDSMNLSSLCINTTAKLIEESMGAEYHKARRYHATSKGAQEAHEAIRPTYIDKDTIAGTQQEKRLYDLIRKRTLACQMADAQVERTTVSILPKSNAPFDGEFTATGEVITFDGFLRVYSESRDEGSENESETRMLPAMAKGETLEEKEITAVERFTQPPTRYNEASLVRKLEELGIGRPSTYAPTITTIQNREYVVRGESEGTKREYTMLTLRQGKIKESKKKEVVGGNKGRLVPTDIGTIVNDFLLENFPHIMSYNFTADIEKQFDAVAEGKEDWGKMIKHFYNDFDPVVEEVGNKRSEKRVGERDLGIDPKTGRPVSVRIGKFGPIVQIGTASDEEKPLFSPLKRDQKMNDITLEEALELFKLPRTLGDYEGETVIIGSGRFGPYIKMGDLYVSVPKGEDAMNITLERSIELVEAKRQAERERHIKKFEEEPELEVLKGRWGPYIAYKGNNYKIPKNKHDKAAELTLTECMDIIKAEGSKAAKKRKK
ncbi:MAG: type I DNA topoisomerase [Bacteroidaceae bacterium]|nr:type I DNA topoisomerase [Bacteroidaceae bacterium]